jgi:HemY protein
MLRGIFVVLVLGAAGFAAASLAEFPGSISLTWSDWRITTSIGIFVAALLVVAAIAAILYRIWWSLRRAPRAIERSRQRRRERLGYEALSRGLVGVAAGDPDTAQRQAKRAAHLLDGNPLTMLLSAQAAQLEGDDRAAVRLFTAMRERGDMEFLGIRGLLAHAMKREDWTEALQLAERAYRLNSKNEWVVATLYELQKRTGHWVDAEATLKQGTAQHLLPKAAAPRERAELLLHQSESVPGDSALKLAKKAFHADMDYPPAAARYAKLLVGAGRHGRAAAVIEQAWAIHPAPELADIYWEARQCADALTKVKAAQKLATHNPHHVESRIAIAVAALEARLWGEARSNLESVAGDDATPRVCRLMAELEEAEHGDTARARMWLLRATVDEHAPQMSSQVPQTADPLPATAEPVPSRT